MVVYSDDQPCSSWKIGRIERVMIGADGQKRAVTVTVSKKGCTSTLDWPIQHLYPLEKLHILTTCQNKESHDATDCESDQMGISSSRPRRSAASRARDRIFAQAMSGWED